MKKTVLTCIILFITACSVFAADTGKTEYERKLEFKRKKIEIVLRTQVVGQTSAYDTRDTTLFNVNLTPEGYSYGNRTSTGRSGETIRFEKISDWVIIRGGIRELSDLDLLEMTGNKEKAALVRAQMEDKSNWSFWGNATFFTGLLTIIGGSMSNPTNSSLITAGSVLTLSGFVVNAVMGSMPRHFIESDLAQEEADNYNIRLKKSLNLPIDYE